MTNLQPIKPSVTVVNQQPITTSQNIAEYFGKRHDDVLKAIRNLIREIPEEYRLRNFAETVEMRKNPSGGQDIASKCYQITKDGFALLAMGFTGSKAVQFKLAYIQAFNTMQAKLAEATKPAPAPAIAPDDTAKPYLYNAEYDFTANPNYKWREPAVVYINDINQAMTNSAHLDNYLGRSHEDIMDLIRSVKTCLFSVGLEELFWGNFFEEEIEYPDANCCYRMIPAYAITRDGITLLSRNLTGVFGFMFFMDFMREFNEAENTIRRNRTRPNQPPANTQLPAPPAKTPRRNTARYHYPKTSLRPPAEHTKSWLTAKTLLENTPKPLYNLLRELERDGHNVEGARLEYDAYRRQLRSIVEASETFAVHAKEMLEVGLPVEWGGRVRCSP